MGQYYRIVNLSKSEHVNPRRLGEGTKLLEFVPWWRFAECLGFLLVQRPADVTDSALLRHPMAGRWAGDALVVAGDYADEGRFCPPAAPHSTLYGLCENENSAEQLAPEGVGARFHIRPIGQALVQALGELKPDSDYATLAQDAGAEEEIMRAWLVRPGHPRLDALRIRLLETLGEFVGLYRPYPAAPTNEALTKYLEDVFTRLFECIVQSSRARESGRTCEAPSTTVHDLQVQPHGRAGFVMTLRLHCVLAIPDGWHSPRHEEVDCGVTLKSGMSVNALYRQLAKGSPTLRKVLRASRAEQRKTTPAR